MEATALDGAYSYFYLSLQQIRKNGITAQQPLGTMLRLEALAAPAASQDINMDIGEEQAGISSEDETLQNRWFRCFFCV